MLGTEKHRCVGRYSTLSSYHRSFCLLTALDISRGSKTKKRRPLCWNQGISCSRGEVLMSSYSLHALLFRHLQMHFIINPRMHSIVILLGLYYAGPVKIYVSRSQGPPSFFFFFFCRRLSSNNTAKCITIFPSHQYSHESTSLLHLEMNTSSKHTM